jgi:hypothetical protein
MNYSGIFYLPYNLMKGIVSTGIMFPVWVYQLCRYGKSTIDFNSIYDEAKTN